MLNDRIVMRVAMLFALAVLPSLASSQASQSSQAKAPDWYGKEVTQITIDGSSEQLKAFTGRVAKDVHQKRPRR
jgi:ABC-type phosphate transport system substrate-binding protein